MFANFGIGKYPLINYKYEYMQTLIYLICKKGGMLKNGRKSTFISKNPKRTNERLKDCSYKKRDNIDRYCYPDTGRLPARNLRLKYYKYYNILMLIVKKIVHLSPKVRILFLFLLTLVSYY